MTIAVNRVPPKLVPVPPAVSEASDYSASVLSANRHHHAAIALTKRSIMLAPTSRELWVNLAAYFIRIQEYNEAMAAVERALALDPDYHIAWGSKAMVFDCTKRFAEAEECYNKALELKPDYDEVRWNRSLMRLAVGDYERGLPEYEIRITFRRHKGRLIYPKFDAPFWKGEDLSDKTIYVAAEQGIGDMILFSRFLPWLSHQAKHVYICCTRDLTSLLWEFRRFVEFVPEGVPVPKTDYAVIIGSLPYHYKLTLDSIPPDPGFISERVAIEDKINAAQLQETEGEHAFKLGLCWSGNPGQERHEERHIPVKHMLDLLDHPHVWAYSFQFGPAEADIRAHGAQRLLSNLSAEMNKGLAVTGTALKKMDLVITCCTSIAHLCGALNVPCWVLLPHDAYWVWLQGRNDSPWYPSIRLFRQKEPGDWKRLMLEVQTALHERLEERSHG